MTLAEVRGKCKSFLVQIPRDVLILAVLVLASTLSFGLGYLAGKEAEQGSTVVLETSPLATIPTSPEVISTVGAVGMGQVVASKNGTKYYLPGCAGAGRISDANKVWFASFAAAAAAGYTPAANCKGI